MDTLVYDKVCMITGLKFKSEIKHSGIEFKSIHFIKKNDNPRDYIHLSESDIYYKNEEIGSYMSKHNKLLKKLEKLKEDLTGKL